MALFGQKKIAAESSDEQAVITHVPLSDDAFGAVEERNAIIELEDELTKAAASVGGEHDGNEVGNGEVVFYTYGPDADILLEAIRNYLDHRVPPGAFAVKRYGRAQDPDSPEERIPLA
jgi:hypothetical protein